ncbi:chorion protein S16 [Bactrocera neohumeralis]|uniref:chorion protein S16 n=1 Tax=Bactrocera tryoni TaxID=59916 RepID=UPI001A98F39E|nr:chorion protein S16 [Bactrocera tryoni]XP_050332913.1 chorion protein S16 [Bactrocera neohumeralis]
MFRFTVSFVIMAVCLCTSAWASQYGGVAPAASSSYGGSAAGGAAGGSSAAQVITLPANVEAQAAALTNAAGAKATAAKINALKWDLLNLYGYEIGYPLLVKKYGPLTSLFSASLPPRSFVGKIDPAFLKDSNGKIKHVGESSIGVVAI